MLIIEFLYRRYQFFMFEVFVIIIGFNFVGYLVIKLITFDELSI